MWEGKGGGSLKKHERSEYLLSAGTGAIHNLLRTTNTLFPPVRRCTTSGAVRDRRRRSERKAEKLRREFFRYFRSRALRAGLLPRRS